MKMFRSVEHNISGSTSFTYSNNLDELSTRLDEGVEAGCLTGGHVEQRIKGIIGWVVFDMEQPGDPPEEGPAAQDKRITIEGIRRLYLRAYGKSCPWSLWDLTQAELDTEYGCLFDPLQVGG